MTFLGSDLVDRRLHRRAVEAAIWGMPAVNYELMRTAMSPDRGNQFVYWSRLLDWRNQTLTPNPDLIYYMAFMDTREGPIVVDIPANDEDQALNGTLCSVFQMPLVDIGRLGYDKGRGGRFVILPPGYTDPVPEGFVPLPCDTYGSYTLIRSVLTDSTQEALDRGLAICHRIRIYPLSQADDPPANQRRDLSDEIVDTLIPYDIRFFETLDRIVQAEPWLERDRALSEILETVGIKRGRPFSPDEHDTKILESAIEETHDLLRYSYENEVELWAEGSQWFFPVTRDFAEAQATGYGNDQVNPYTNRGVIYHMAFIGIKHVGTAQFYLVDLRDSDGNLFDSAKHYRLRLPAGVPVSQYWSVVVYDGHTHGLIRGNDQYSVTPMTEGLRVNDDGSVDVHFAQRRVPGFEANTIPTSGSSRFELMFRFYGVQPEVMSKEWILPNVELVSD
ncbi:DUF1254 domain-containing protein [Nocardioides panacihumi]|uniref:DUF1254 domain-containing protein n=1 Tax=Nocardioides panacihumi TaxID=400774 RepID=A0ABN2QVE0_9ACTN